MQKLQANNNKPSSEEEAASLLLHLHNFSLFLSLSLARGLFPASSDRFGSRRFFLPSFLRRGRHIGLALGRVKFIDTHIV